MNLLWLGDFYYNYNFVSDDIDEISKWIKSNNFSTILNLEGPIIDCKPNDFDKISKRGPNLFSTKESIKALKKINTIGVSLANNHIMDYGNTGLSKTIDILDSNKIKHSGAGFNLDEALKPMCYNLNNKTMAVFSFGWNVEETMYAEVNESGCAPLEESIVLNAIKIAKKSYDKIIICCHWGFEYNRYPMPFTVKMAHKLIDSGADLIVGNHPHCVQPYERYNGKLIFYSLGNFYFSSRRKRFSKKFNEKISNQCDYGVGIITNSELNDFKFITIKYDKSTDSSVICDNVSDILYDLSGTNFKNLKYYFLVKKSKKNINPILTNCNFLNSLKIKGLFLIYNMKRQIKKLLKLNIK